MDKPPEATGRKQADTRFKPGQSGNPNGRPKGSRNKLGEAFVADLYEAWQARGVEVIQRVMDERPQDALKVIASLLPKQVEIKEDAFGDLSDEQLAAIIATARSTLGVCVEGGGGTSAEEGAQQAPGLPAVH